LEEKWLYIKDRKVSSFDQYGIAPFDASKEVKILASWDSPPTEAEMAEIKPLLARIQALKSGKGGALQALNLWHFSCNVKFNPFSIVFPNCGLILAWEILLEYLIILWKRKISTSE
jgi:hypothetical protein